MNMAKPETILLIDDSEADNHYHEIILNRVNKEYKIQAISNSIKALDYLSRCIGGENDQAFPRPDLVFIDINMPALNGFELLDKLRRAHEPEQIKKGTKIFMLTGSLNPDDKKKAKDNFADLIDGFCIKPLSEKIFREILNEHF